MSKHVNLFYIDLDNFKKINDEYGHQAGDTVLVMVAKLLKQTFGAEFIARVGGDEFLAVVLGSKTDAELAILAERFLSSQHRYCRQQCAYGCRPADTSE